MPELVLVATDGSGRWPIAQPEVTMGREPHCDIVIDGNRYPAVSRFHAIVRLLPDGSREIQSLGSANGLLVNGALVARAALGGGDRVQLGAGGPEFAVQAVMGQAAGAPNRIGAVETVVMGMGRAGVASPEPEAGGFSPGGLAAGGARRPAPEPPARAYDPAPAAPAAFRNEPGLGDVAASLRRQIRSMRSLLVLSIIVNGTLVGLLYFQIARTQDQVRSLRSSAQNAVGLLEPQLNARLNQFEKQVDQVNVQMKRSQNEFFARAHREIPQILDTYVNRKVKELQAIHSLPQ